MGEPNMKIRNVIPLIVIGCILLAPLGYTQQATSAQATTKTTLTTIDLIDCTGKTPVKTTIQLPHDQYTALQAQLAQIRTSDLAAKEKFIASVQVLKAYHLIASDVNADIILQHFYRTTTASQRLTRTLPLLNNTNINAMCAIFFSMQNGTTAVLGLNSFMNLIGFDIISFHKGYVTDGIKTSGLVNKDTPPGQYVGFMFGFLGYWFGDRTSVGIYSNVTAAGFTVITAWAQI